MPYKTDKYRLPEGKDRGVKLTDRQREEIKTLYGTVSQRELARQYKVSRRLIQFIGDPEKYKRNLECREKRGGWKQYYKKSKHAQAMRDHRV